MNSNDEHIFKHLKDCVIDTFLKSYNTSKNIKEWSGDDISYFQEDLFSKVKAKVSEKWFYTYFKNQPSKLPRIDMLNLLCQYVGYNNWNAFKLKNHKKSIKKTKSILYAIFLIPIVVIVYWYNTRVHTFNFCFVDDLQGLPIKNVILDIKILENGESPIYLKTDSLGCFSYETKKEELSFIVQSPYHKTDTITRSFKHLNNGMVKLNTDDYALMLDYYTNNRIIDWKRHRSNLEALFSNDAIIYQIFPNNIGIELYSKDEFIEKLTIPTRSLKGMTILNKSYENGKIVSLKFIIQ